MLVSMYNCRYLYNMRGDNEKSLFILFKLSRLTWEGSNAKMADIDPRGKYFLVSFDFNHLLWSLFQVVSSCLRLQI